MPARKPKGYKVTGAVAVIRQGRNERYVYRGGVFAASAIDEDNAKHLLSAGLIVAHDPVEPEPDAGADSGTGDASADSDKK